MKKENIYRTIVTTLRPGHSTETHVLKVWKMGEPWGPVKRTINGWEAHNPTPHKVHISKDYSYILKMERGYLAQKITSISP